MRTTRNIKHTLVEYSDSESDSEPECDMISDSDSTDTYEPEDNTKHDPDYVLSDTDSELEVKDAYYEYDYNFYLENILHPYLERKKNEKREHKMEENYNRAPARPASVSNTEVLSERELRRKLRRLRKAAKNTDLSSFTSNELNAIDLMTERFQM